MLHFEVEVDDLAAAVAAARSTAGAAPKRRGNRPTATRQRIRIVLDPAGHPLCLFVRGE